MKTPTRSKIWIYVFFISILIVGCQSRRIFNFNTSTSLEDKSGSLITEVLIQEDQKSELSPNQNSKYFKPENAGHYRDDDTTILVTRTFGSDTLSFYIHPNHKGGEASHSVLDRDYTSWDKEGLNQVRQLSPTVLCYSGIPAKVEGKFFIPLQPLFLEFLDSSWQTKKRVDIWSSRPYNSQVFTPMNYYDFDAETMGVIRYDQQTEPIVPDRYSLFTNVRSESNHVVVNYELRSIKGNSIVKVEHTLHIYNLEGQLQYIIQLPSVDGAVVSNNGEYIMYTFGGIGLRNANNPFATIGREGWAIMNLHDKKVLYTEYTDDGNLAFGRLWSDQNFLRIAYSTPSTEIDYDYWVFFDEKSKIIYTHKLTALERLTLRADHDISPMDFSYKNYFIKFNFQHIPVSTN